MVNDVEVALHTILYCLYNKRISGRWVFILDPRQNLARVDYNSIPSRNLNFDEAEANTTIVSKKGRLWVWADIWQFTSSNPKQTIKTLNQLQRFCFCYKRSTFARCLNSNTLKISEIHTLSCETFCGRKRYIYTFK